MTSADHREGEGLLRTKGAMEVAVWRGDRHGGQYQQFSVPRHDSQTVLDAVAWIQQEADPTLSYRFACRVGMCGTCAMMVNGVPRWTCRTHVDRVLQGGRIEIAPLRNFPVIKDLATDMDPFFEKWGQAEGVFHPEKTRHEPVQIIAPESAGRPATDAGIECINCGVCYAACDTVASRPNFLGPAALNRAWTLLNDTKDAKRSAVLDAVTKDGGCHACHAMGSCSAFCPNELSPLTAIAGLKRASLRRVLGAG